MESKATITHPAVTLGNWIVTIIIMLIPIVNIIMLFVWAFSSTTNPSKANWAKASLIFYAIGTLVFLLFGSMLAGMFYHLYPCPY